MTDEPTHEIVAAPESLQLAIDRPIPPDQNPARMYIASLAAGGSQRVMRAALQTAADIFTSDSGIAWDAFPWWKLRHAHTNALRTRLAEQFAPATANRILTAVRQVLRECRRSDLRLISADDCANAIDIKPVRGKRLPAGRALEREEMDRMFAGVEEDRAIGLRDRALLTMLADGGLRRDEAASIRIEDYDVAASLIRVIGKGNKERRVFVGSAMAEAIQAWLQVRGRAPGPLLTTVDRWGNILRDHPLDGGTVYTILRKIADRTAVDDVSPHDFRRTFISALIDDNTDIATIAKMVGHDEVNTTARYDRRGDEAARRAAEAISGLVRTKKTTPP